MPGGGTRRASSVSTPRRLSPSTSERSCFRRRRATSWGLHRADRRCHGGTGAGFGRPERDRNLASSLLHPVQDWSRAFDQVPIYLHAADQQWIMRPAPEVHLWRGDTLEIAPSTTLVRLGGHFAGGTVLHWAGTEDRLGLLLSGDIVQVASDARRVSFLWSYPNMMPLPAREVCGSERLSLPGRLTGSTARSQAKRSQPTPSKS